MSSTPCADKNTKCNYSAKKLRNQCDSENYNDDKKRLIWHCDNIFCEYMVENHFDQKCVGLLESS